MTVTWQELDLEGPRRVRDLWRQQDVGEFREAFQVDVPRHGVALVRLWPQ
jgi:alpha-galactosidase